MKGTLGHGNKQFETGPYLFGHGFLLGKQNSLSTRAAITPDIPSALEPLFCADAADFWTGDAFVIAIVPFPNVFGDLYVGITREAIGWAITVGFPRECA
jgi:hypothetical protein